ncbi:MAG TPA: response regulator [Stellaceae bacterium]|jgi:DNA-binding response OmpR family regulator
MEKICHVLIVEDQGDIADLLAEFLSGEGYQMHIARDGATMRSAVAAYPLDVVILDLTLPGPESGWALAELAVDQGLGLIVVTGDHANVERLELGEYRYLLKPFRLDALLMEVENALKDVNAHCAPDANRRAAGGSGRQ